MKVGRDQGDGTDSASLIDGYWWKSSQTSPGLIFVNTFINAFSVEGWKWLMTFYDDIKIGSIVSIDMLSSSTYKGSVRTGIIAVD